MSAATRGRACSNALAPEKTSSSRGIIELPALPLIFLTTVWSQPAGALAPSHRIDRPPVGPPNR